MMTSNLKDIKSVSFRKDRNATTVKMKNGNQFGWTGSKAKDNFTQLSKELAQYRKKRKI